MLNRQGISLGRILGIPIGLDYSWFLVFVLITWTLAASYYPGEFNNWPVAEIGVEPPSARAEFWIALAGSAITSNNVRRHLRPACLRAIRRKWPPPGRQV